MPSRPTIPCPYGSAQIQLLALRNGRRLIEIGAAAFDGLTSRNAFPCNAKKNLEGAIGANLCFSCSMLDMIGKVLWVGEEFPNMARHAPEGCFEAFRLVLLCHMGLAFHYSNVDRFLVFCS